MDRVISQFRPKFIVTNRMASAITSIERARGFLVRHR